MTTVHTCEVNVDEKHMHTHAFERFIIDLTNLSKSARYNAHYYIVHWLENTPGKEWSFGRN